MYAWEVVRCADCSPDYLERFGVGFFLHGYQVPVERSWVPVVYSRGGDRTDFLYPKVLLMRSKDNTIFIRETGYISENTHSFTNSMYFLNSLPPDGCEEKAHKASPNELVNITRIAVAHEECCDMS